MSSGQPPPGQPDGQGEPYGEPPGQPPGQQPPPPPPGQPQPDYGQPPPGQYTQPLYGQPPTPPQPGGYPPQPGYAQPGYAQPGYQQPGYAQTGYAQPGYQGPPPKQSHTLRNVLLILLGVLILLFVGCSVLVGTVINKADKTIKSEVSRHAPTTVTPGQEFIHDGFRVTGGWQLGKVQGVNLATISNLRVTNEANGAFTGAGRPLCAADLPALRREHGGRGDQLQQQADAGG